MSVLQFQHHVTGMQHSLASDFMKIAFEQVLKANQAGLLYPERHAQFGIQAVSLADAMLAAMQEADAKTKDRSPDHAALLTALTDLRTRLQTELDGAQHAFSAHPPVNLYGQGYHTGAVAALDRCIKGITAVMEPTAENPDAH